MRIGNSSIFQSTSVQTSSNGFDTNTQTKTTVLYQDGQKRSIENKEKSKLSDMLV